jgi:hypothetical protein
MDSECEPLTSFQRSGKATVEEPPAYILGLDEMEGETDINTVNQTGGNDFPADIRLSRRSSVQPQTQSDGLFADNQSEIGTNDGGSSKNTSASVVSSTTGNAGIQRVEICFPDLSSAILNSRNAPVQQPNPPAPAIASSITIRQLLRALDDDQAEQERSILTPGPPRMLYFNFASSFHKLGIWSVEDLLLIRNDLVSCGQSPAKSIIEQLKEAGADDFELDFPTYPQMARILQKASSGRL